MAVTKLSVHKIVRDEDWFRWSNETNNDISVIKIVKPAISLSLTQSAQTVKCIRIVKLAVKHLEFLHAPWIIDRKLLEILDERIRLFSKRNYFWSGTYPQIGTNSWRKHRFRQEATLECTLFAMWRLRYGFIWHYNHSSTQTFVGEAWTVHN